MSKKAHDKARSVDRVAARNMSTVRDRCTHKTRWTIFKFSDEDGLIEKLLKKGFTQEHIANLFPHRLLGISRFIGHPNAKGNLCLNTGIQGFEKLIAGLSSPPNAWSNTYAYLGVGDSTTAAAATQTDLQASSNYTYVAMASGYPSQSSQTLSWQASFSSAVANYAWNEFVVTNASSKGSGVVLNRLVSSQGTKTSGQTWKKLLSPLYMGLDCKHNLVINCA
ncbi:MAG: hypothetical protein ABSC20_09655 [Candidatus Bathyarchaeia archaeon]|jgi:hypothetical protein